MSLARVHRTEKVRKDWKCEKCGAAIKKGVDGRISFSVGFRGRERTRCTDPKCYPKPSERESSAVSQVYAAQEEVDFSMADSLDTIQEMIYEIADEADAVAEEYEYSEMYHVNEDLQERASMLREAGETLRNEWDSGLSSPPEAESGPAYREWLEEARQAAEAALNEMELP